MPKKIKTKTNVAHYDIEFLHPSKGSLSKLIKSTGEDKKYSFTFQDSPRKVRGQNLFYVKAIASFEETAYDILSDKLMELLNKVKFLEVGGTFIDNYGRGYINCFGCKDYTRFFK